MSDNTNAHMMLPNCGVVDPYPLQFDKKLDTVVVRKNGQRRYKLFATEGSGKIF
jgi:hypothetical protein